MTSETTVFPAPKIDFGGEAQKAKTLSAEREKNIRIRELLLANNALVEEKRKLRRGVNRAMVHAFQFGMVFGIVITVVAITIVAALFRFWLFK